jgi:peptidoglycan hydrolase-like amidase
MKRLRIAAWAALSVVALGAVFGACLNLEDHNSGSGLGAASGEYECAPEGAAIPETILVDLGADGVVEMDLEDYVKGVVPQEIGTSFPQEAIRAQAIAARTYAVRWILDGKEPICTDTMCQVYGDARYAETDVAVNDTSGVVGFYDSDVIVAVFFASSGGHTEDVHDVWGGYLDYLVAVPDLENEICTGDCGAWGSVDEAPCDPDTDANCCYGRNGHGVGLSQRGAQAMAECGFDHTEILTHFYSGASLVRNCE